MRKFKVNVNGVAYNVEVAEEGVVAVAAPVAAAPVAAAPVAAAPVAEAPVVEAPKAAPVAAAGDTTMKAPMPGSVSKIVAKEGQTVKKGDVIIMLEAMKMQNEMASPVAGTVKSIAVSVGESVKPGQIMAIIG
jgi:glutaconyl-CoA decarboxylase